MTRPAHEDPTGPRPIRCVRAFHSPAAAVCVALVLGTLLLFSRTLQCGFLDLDDPDYVTANSHVRDGLTVSAVRWALTSDAAGNWHPLTWISHMIDWQLFGIDPRGHHAVNVVWHGLNAALAFLVFLRLTKPGDAISGRNTYRPSQIWLSGAAAALFAWHPLRVESVAWISERKDVLSTFFGLLTLLFYARYAGRSVVHGPLPLASDATRRVQDLDARRSTFDYVLTLVCFGLGLMCKPMLVTLPLLLLVLDWWPLRRGERSEVGGRRSEVGGPRSEVGGESEQANHFLPLASALSPQLWLEKIPFFLLSAVVCLLAFLAQRKGGAIVETLPLHIRLENAIASVAGYTGEFFWPFNLAIGYPYSEHQSLPTIFMSALLVVSLTVLAFQQRQRRPWLLCGWLWFLVMLLPAIGVVQAGLQSMADRYTYMPMAGLAVALVWTVAESKLWPAFPRFGIATVVVIFTACGWRTWDQLGYWRNSHTLFDHALAVTKGNYLAHCYSGTTFFGESRFEDARLQFQQAIALKPDYATAQFRLGLTLEKLGRDADALMAYEGFLKSRPDDAPGQLHCANILARLNRDEEALGHYAKAVEMEPACVEAQCNFADSLRAVNRLGEACSHYRRAIALTPSNAVAFYGLGAALEDSGHREEALASYRKAIQLKPDFASAHYDLGALLLNIERPGEAVPCFRAAIEIRPDFAAAYAGLGFAEAQLNQTQAAVRDLERARTLDPEVAGVPETLARLRETDSVRCGGGP